MLRSMFSGVSGLRSHQIMMDVVGNNIANVNTTGFKSSRVTFQDTLSQLIKGGSGPGSRGRDTGGMNTQQVGLGVRVGAIDQVSTQGSLQNTNRNTDMAIQGDGFFIVKSGENTLYTRAGNFGFDNEGNLVDPSGSIVQGFMADTDGRINTTGLVRNIKLPLGQSVAPLATATVVLGGNLSTTTPIGDAVLSPVQVYDARGNAHFVTFEYKRTAPDTWDMRAFVTKADGTAEYLGAGGGDVFALTFNTGGDLTSSVTPVFTLEDADGNDVIGADDAPQQIRLDMGEPTSPLAIHQYGGPSTAGARSQDGAPTGFLRSFTVGDDGVFTGLYSNGVQKSLAQIAIASFTNPGSSNAAGLVKMGNNHLRADKASGQPAIGIPGTIGNGTLASGMLEMSNVDLAQEFTHLIVAQRGFQANSRIISASDELLQEVVNIKR